MPLITLQSKFLIDNSTTNNSFLLLLRSGNQVLQNGPLKVMSAFRQQTWEEFKLTNLQQLQNANAELTEFASHYFRSYKHTLFDIAGKHQLKFNGFEVAFATVNSKLEGTVLAAYFFSKPYLLVESFGKYLLLSEEKDKSSDPLKTFMVEISELLTIHTYLQ
jgi:hypothetical protein